MFYYIKGGLTVSNPTMAVVEAGGVGYKLTVSETTWRSLPRASLSDPKEVLLYTYFSVREDGIELYGFGNERELASFRMLLSVSGVGPKAAMAILSQMTPEKFALAVCTEDKKAISKAQGVGPKTAARIILELRDKLMKETSMDDDDLSKAITDHTNETADAPARGKLSEAQDALIVLGYSRAEAQNALKNIDVTSLSLEDIIKQALKQLMKN
ncbi:MAG: Holliday junction branch migration protein RuvA [Clostridia bacterium]|nr:Holliday junction branch migration protein RuvA [Clostridia bacterium]